jgi:hypothetical protein
VEAAAEPPSQAIAHAAADTWQGESQALEAIYGDDVTFATPCQTQLRIDLPLEAARLSHHYQRKVLLGPAANQRHPPPEPAQCIYCTAARWTAPLHVPLRMMMVTSCIQIYVATTLVWWFDMLCLIGRLIPPTIMWLSVPPVSFVQELQRLTLEFRVPESSSYPASPPLIIARYGLRSELCYEIHRSAHAEFLHPDAIPDVCFVIERK